MSRNYRFPIVIALVSCMAFGLASASEPIQSAMPSVPLRSAPDLSSLPSRGTAPQPAQVAPTKPLTSEQVRVVRDRGVKWLLTQQQPDGGFAAGGRGAHSNAEQASASDVATTAYASLALVRDGRGVDKHRVPVRKATEFIVAAVENAPAGPLLRTPEGTQVQVKMGRLIDTHLASMYLGEMAGRFDGPLNARIDKALDVVVAKQQAAQRADGSFDDQAWAPVLSTSIAAQSLNKAAESGRKVSEDVLARSEAYQAQLASPTGAFDASAGAGVELYALAGALGSNTQTAKRDDATPAAQARAKSVAQSATTRVAGDSSGRLMAGFGSIGGEEMVSYLMISDALVTDGGKEWADWNGRVSTYLGSIQNQDGSWVGHHCITSGVFTTAGALLTFGAEDWQASQHGKQPARVTPPKSDASLIPELSQAG